MTQRVHSQARVKKYKSKSHREKAQGFVTSHDSNAGTAKNRSKTKAALMDWASMHTRNTCIIQLPGQVTKMPFHIA
jgi:hypothetical protein